MPQDNAGITADAAISAAQSFARAMVVGDAATLERLITSDFTYTHSSARVEPAAELLASVCAGRKNKRMDFEDLRVRAYPGMAIVSGLNHMHTSTDKTFDARFSLVLTAIEGRWRVLAYHSTQIPEK
jgi:ketosteroid isomerase-like protein